MSKILADLTPHTYPKFHLGHTHLVRDDGGLYETQPGQPVGAKIRGKRMPSPRHNSLSMTRVKTHEPVVEVKISTRQHQAQKPRNARRLYRPQDQRGAYPVFQIMDRVTGQVLARVRGTVNHVEVEAEQLARSQGGDLADLKILIQGEIE